MKQTSKRIIFSWVLILSMVISVIAPGSAAVANAAGSDYQAKLTGVTKCLHDNVEPVYSGEWALLQQARGENPDKKWLHSYYDSLMDQLKDEEKTAKMGANDWARVILALEALDVDPANVDGKNLFENLANFSMLDNGSIYDVATMSYVLMGIGNRNDTIFASEKVDEKDRTTKDKIKDKIISYYDEDNKCYGAPDWYSGAWTIDPDTAAMAIQGLASYYKTDAKVKAIVDNSLTTLSEQVINDDACVNSWGAANACSTAQVICALVSVGIDPTKDARFVKNDKTLIDGLCTFFDPTTGGINATDWSTGAEYLDLAYNTVQAGYALVAYDRFVAGKTFVFDCSDVNELLYTCGDGNHTWGTSAEVYKEPTCTVDGKKAVLCRVCGEVKDKDAIEIIPALGHKGGKATCIDKAVCEVCGQEYGELDKTNHSGDTSIVNKKEATCTEKGYTGDKVCSGCGAVIENGAEIAAKGHTPVEIPAIAATETTAGKTAGKKCSVCGEILEAQKDVPATGKKEETTATTSNVNSKIESVSTDYKLLSNATESSAEYVCDADKTKSSVTIQNTVKDTNGTEHKVTKVADSAFAGSTALKSVTLGANVTEIGANAFKGCTKLSNVITQNDKLTTIGVGSFSGAKALKEIDFSECNLQSVDTNAFSGCKNLKNIKLNGNKLTVVGKNAFKNIKKNAKITIYAKNKKTYNKVVKLIKKSGAKKVKYAFKKKK